MKKKETCKRCRRIIKKRVAYKNCKPYCSFCFDTIRVKSNSHSRPLSKLWEQWIKMGRANTRKTI